MNYSQFINSNDSQLRKNYLLRYKHIKRSSFAEYCRFIFVALDKGFWLDKSYKQGIIFNKQENEFPCSECGDIVIDLRCQEKGDICGICGTEAEEENTKIKENK